MDRSKHHLLRFGIFEVDLKAQELRRRGRRVKLHGQPFQVLAPLLERPGEVVTRQELRQRLWSSETFVDFDNGLNIAVMRLRQVLRDSAENPKMIETLPRVGYRFISQVEQAEAEPGLLAVEDRRRLPQSVVSVVEGVWSLRRSAVEAPGPRPRAFFHIISSVGQAQGVKERLRATFASWAAGAQRRD